MMYMLFFTKANANVMLFVVSKTNCNDTKNETSRFRYRSNGYSSCIMWNLSTNLVFVVCANYVCKFERLFVYLKGAESSD